MFPRTGDIPPPPVTLPSPPSKLEAEFYYSGLPSAPVLVARSGTTVWEEQAYRKIKELRAVGHHAIKGVWEDNLAPKIHAILDLMKVNWTSTDVVRIGNAKEPSAPVILWIGVMPQSLSGNEGTAVASMCRDLLTEHAITDIEVEIRESVVTRSAGPKLLSSALSSDATANIREPLATTLGLTICAQTTPWDEGTGGFFITEGGNTKRLLLVTARHIVFPPDENKRNNKHFTHRNSSQRRHNVLLFGNSAFVGYLESMKAEIEVMEDVAQYQERRVDAMDGRDDKEANIEREEAQDLLD